MDPIIVKAMGDGWRIYMMPARWVLERRIATTHGKQWDSIERQTVVGGLPHPLESVPHIFATKADALASLRRMAA